MWKPKNYFIYITSSTPKIKPPQPRGGERFFCGLASGTGALGASGASFASAMTSGNGLAKGLPVQRWRRLWEPLQTDLSHTDGNCVSCFNHCIVTATKIILHQANFNHASKRPIVGRFYQSWKINRIGAVSQKQRWWRVWIPHDGHMLFGKWREAGVVLCSSDLPGTARTGLSRHCSSSKASKSSAMMSQRERSKPPKRPFSLRPTAPAKQLGNENHCHKDSATWVALLAGKDTGGLERSRW